MQLNNTDSIVYRVEALIDRVYSDESERLVIKNKINDYVNYLLQWVTTHNVVSRKNTVDDIWLNVFDSLAFVEKKNGVVFQQIIRENAVVDAGAGGGFPGIPLAIFFATKKFELIDINRKKCSFLRSIKARLVLKNVSVRQADITTIEPASFMVTKAAFSPAHAGVLVTPLMAGGRLVIWANAKIKEQFKIALLSQSMRLEADEHYDLPGYDDRCLLLFRKV